MDISKELIIRFFKGRCSEHEEIEVTEWLSASEQNTQQAMQLLESSDDQDERLFLQLLIQSGEVWDSTTRTTDTMEVESPLHSQESIEGIGQIYLWTTGRYVAAVIALLIAISTVHFYYKYKPIYITSDFGQIKRVTLPDGSKVTLKGKSSLQYKLVNGEFAREVWLNGEGFFNIQHTTDHRRFRVNTETGKQVEVLGTEFTLMERMGKSRVVLKSGSILLRGPETKEMLLKPGDLVEMDVNQAKITSYALEKVEVEAYSAWAMPKWQLDGTPLKELLKKVENSYGIHVIANDTSLLKKKASGSIPLTEEGVEVLLQDIAELFQLKLIQVDNKWILSI
ncbi:FecR family protein [Dyadobacter tibetensis]|uniref:FecR family protein n=1 Tax=Dyadobacter tibetensis TaxID=1211851 RepID=UPI000470D0B5|nr:FecR domain-containing protein [Dyadobacter tibetensis]